MNSTKFDINKIVKEFGDNDFGFTASEEEDFSTILSEKDNTVEEYKRRLEEVEKIILPFLTKLLKTADQPVIKWPNRKAILEEQIQKILNLTRG